MKLGIGLYKSMLTPENFRFAKQIGCTHLVAHLVDYFQDQKIHGTDGQGNTWGVTLNEGNLWSEDELKDLVRSIESEGLKLEAIENLDPAYWYDILLDGPKRDEQIAGIQEIIRRMGRAGIPILGYNFSIAGVWGHVVAKHARGGAEAVSFLGEKGPEETPIPNGQIWNMIYSPEAEPGFIPSISSEQIWDRLGQFLKEVIPVAEESGVALAAHPDDPPMPTLRETPRLVYQPHLYRKLLDSFPSPANKLEFCLGTLQEMSEGNLMETIDEFSGRDAIGYVHCRNVRGKVPEYYEVFIDEGDIDVPQAMEILHRNGYQGLVIPDHTPLPECGAPWHAGMAHAVGYLRGILNMPER